MTTVPLIIPRQIDSLADALDAWLPCPYPRLALVQWLEAYMASWALNDQAVTVSEGSAQSMLHEHYREWVEVFDESQR
ncbi:hypothetical protein [Pseudomonas sp. NPDC086251]|uniref:hypothetical protein n=1 Tax=Pseudomonas sp. NPDC086251 TaxID=3364431 RepID=UPI00383965D7